MKAGKKLNIAMLGHKRVPSREGGIEVVAEELARRMVQCGHSVTCFNRRGSHVSGENIEVLQLKEHRGIRLKEVFTIDKKGLAAVSSSFFATVKASLGSYDLVHIHAEGPAFMCFLPKLFGKRVIVTIHGLDWQRAKWGRFASAYIMAGERNAAKFADRIIVLSKGVQEYFRQTYNRQTVFIPNGVNRPQPVPPQQIREKFGLEKDGYILYLGRLVPEKGIQYLIKAFRAVKTDKKLVIAGGSSDTDSFAQQLKEMAAEDKRVIFTGFVQGQLLEELYSNAFIYVLPSDVEGMPLSLLEALSYGNCCLVSDIAECTEVVEDRAVVFEKGNISDLKEKLQQLCDDPSAVEEYKKQAADFVCRKYNWDRVTEHTLALYR